MTKIVEFFFAFVFISIVLVILIVIITSVIWVFLRLLGIKITLSSIYEFLWKLITTIWYCIITGIILNYICNIHQYFSGRTYGQLWGFPKDVIFISVGIIPVFFLSIKKLFFERRIWQELWFLMKIFIYFIPLATIIILSNELVKLE